MTTTVRRLLLAAGAVVAGVVAVVGGLAPARALVVVAGVAAVGLVLTETRPDPTGWPAPLPGPSRPAWTEVERIAAAVAGADRDPRAFDATVSRRLGGLARDTLARAGIPWEDPRAAELLGPATWEALEHNTGRPALIAPTLTVLADVEDPATGVDTPPSPPGAR